MSQSWPVQFIYEPADDSELIAVRTESFSAETPLGAIEAAKRYAHACPSLVATANLLVLDDETRGVYEEAML